MQKLVAIEVQRLMPINMIIRCKICIHCEMNIIVSHFTEYDVEAAGN